MTDVRRRMRGMGGWLLAASALSGGCLSFCHPVGGPPPEQVQGCGMLPPFCRHHVYVFFVNGIDPLACANFAGVREYVQSLGFIKTYYGQCYHGGTMAKEIGRLHTEDPNAHFALIGYGVGAKTVRSLADTLRYDGIFVDLLVYFGGDGLERRPANVGRVVNFRTKEGTTAGELLEDAVNVTFSDVSSYGSPAHQFALETLAHELTTVAGTVPVIDRHTQSTVAPPPVPAPARTAAAPDEWDFLKFHTPNGETAAPPQQKKTAPKEPAPAPSTIGRI